MVNALAHVTFSGVLRSQRASNFCGMGTLATEVMQAFHQRLRRARQAAGYQTAKEFADVLEVEPPTYRQWERGEASPDLVTLTRICKALDIEPNDLLPLARRKRTPGANGSSTQSTEPGVCG
jgi:DNA-binding XRE family transcriptional regulator